MTSTQGVAEREDEFAASAPDQSTSGALIGAATGGALGFALGGAIGAGIGGVIGGIAGFLVGPTTGPATFSAGPVHQVNNLANCVVNRTPVGVTWPLLNGRQFWSTAQARVALRRPTLRTFAAPGGGFDSEVAALPTNTGSFDETVLAPGPWTINAPKARIRARIPALVACTGPGDTTFQAHGDPSDAAMFTANRRHEDHHANDHRTAFNATILPWATSLAATKANGQRFHGATAPAAEAALWGAAGGTPDDVAEAFFQRCLAAVVAYHGSAAGGPVGAPTAPGADAGCGRSWASYHNPS